MIWEGVYTFRTTGKEAAPITIEAEPEMAAFEQAKEIVEQKKHPAQQGGCGVVCTENHASGMCRAGMCGLGACDPGRSNCNGLAVDGCKYANTGFATDSQNCGGCGKKCQTGYVCQAGACTLSNCPAGFSDCNGSAADGCEYPNASFATDPNNSAAAAGGRAAAR